MSNGEIDRHALRLISENISTFPHPNSFFQGIGIVPEKYTIGAQLLHREQLCVKNVHGAMLILTNNGMIEMYGRNGLTHGSPKQLIQFTTGNMLSLTDEETDQRLITALRSQRDTSTIISCRDLALRANCAYCLKDIRWNDIEDKIIDLNTRVHQSRSSEKYCPNNRAQACTERLFLNVWLPYALELQKRLIEEHSLNSGESLIIKQVRFNQNSNRPDLEFMTTSKEAEGFQWRKNMHPTTLIEQRNAIEKILLITQYAPCTDCAKDFSHHPLLDKLELHMVDLSRHKGIGSQPTVGLDHDDINALSIIIGAHIPVTYNKLDKIKLVWRQNLE